MKLLLLLISIQVFSSTANITPLPGSITQLEENLANKLDRKCSSKDNSSCMLLNLMKNINSILTKSEIAISPKVDIVKRKDFFPEVESNTLNALRTTESDEVLLFQLMMEKFKTFVKSRALKWKLSDLLDLILSKEQNGRLKIEMSVDGERVLKEGRGKMKKNGPMIGWIVLKGLLLGILAFKALFVLSGKALLISKLAFLFSSLIGIKNLLHNKDGKGHVTTYEIQAAGHRRNAENLVTQNGWDSFMENAAEAFLQKF